MNHNLCEKEYMLLVYCSHWCSFQLESPGNCIQKCFLEFLYKCRGMKKSII